MDFEKEAREIRTQIEKSSRGQSVICDSELPFLAQALRKAYLSGEESMRERAAELVKTHGVNIALRGAAKQRSAVFYNGDMPNCPDTTQLAYADAILSLPCNPMMKRNWGDGRQAG